MGHVWLEPVTLLWHRYLGFGETAEQSQKHINTVFAAAGIAVFYAMLLKFKLPLLRWIVATALVAASCNILTLAPTGHMKLLAFPFLTAAFYYAVSWERDLARDGTARRSDLIRSAAFLAIASAFHTSCFAAPPFTSPSTGSISPCRRCSCSLSWCRATPCAGRCRSGPRSRLR